MIIQTIKHFLSDNVRTSSLYQTLRAHWYRCAHLLYFLYDVWHAFVYMRWIGEAKLRYRVKSSELLFQYHKIEKGLVMPGPKRFFGADAASSTMQLLSEWREFNFSIVDPIYLGAIEALRSYRAHIDEYCSDQISQLKSRLDHELRANQDRESDLTTPIPTDFTVDDFELSALSSICKKRRSVRSFDSRCVEFDKIRTAVAMAQSSPSACNRQPNRVYMYSKKRDIDALLALQNGNRGFGHAVPALLILAADAGCYFDASERHQPFIDSGLFAMCLLQALQVQGLASCCLNWCVSPKTDKIAHRLGSIPSSERIIMFIAVGYPIEGAMAPRSARRRIDDIFICKSLPVLEE